MAPINIDGSPVQDITIDGQPVTEVTVDGDVVFPAIPDSATYFWDPATFSTGDNTWTDQVEGLGMTINGNPQKTVFSDGSPAISPDGTGDFGQASNTDILAETFSLEFEVQTTESSDREHIFGSGDGTTILLVYINQDGDFNTDSGAVTLFYREGSGQDGVGYSFNIPIDDGVKHKVSIVINDASAADVNFFVDGVDVNESFDRENGNVDFSGDTLPVNPAYFARNSSGSISGHWSGKVGKYVFHDKAITEQKI